MLFVGGLRRWLAHGDHRGARSPIAGRLRRGAPRPPGRFLRNRQVRFGTGGSCRVPCPCPPASAGGLATATYAPPAPTLTLDADISEQYAYEVLVFDLERDRQLVAAVEIVSPANKDRPDSRQ